MLRTLVVVLALAAASAQAALLAPEPAPGGTGHFKVIIPHIGLGGGTTTVALKGPPPGVEVLQATWFVNYFAPHGGTPASDLVLELNLTGLPPMVVTGADFGWPASAGMFSGSFTSSDGGVVQGGDTPTTAQLSIHSTIGLAAGQVSGAVLLELAPVCQKNAGYEGPGQVSLSMCGDPLFTGGHADVVVNGAPPFAPLAFFAGITGGPMPFKGGFLVAKPRFLIILTQADASGSLLVDMPGGGAHVIFFLQVAVADPQQPNGVALSNGLIVELLP